jgi:protein-L-isoaspartate(D-aspartate) O-methyltransferase
VTSVEVGRKSAAAAAAALRRAGFAETVRVIEGDGYAGASDHAPWDRIIVTCGIAGIPPAWLDMLAPDGLVVAPIAFAGYHPVMAVRDAGGELRGSIGVWADFMPAVGPLRPRRLFRHNAGAALRSSGVRLMPGAVAATNTEEYQDLTCYLGAHDIRTTRADVYVDDFRPADGMTALVEGDAAAWVQRPGCLVATGPSTATDPLVEQLRHLVGNWVDEGRPIAAEWSAAFEQSADLEPGLLTPVRWQRAAEA